MVSFGRLLATLWIVFLPVDTVGQSKVDPFDFLEEWDLISQDFRRGKLDMTPEGLPAGYDTEMSKTSDDGHFHVSIRPASPPAPLNEIHTWLVEIRTETGEPVSEANISFFGSMPLHGHGFPTVPRLGDEIDQGVYTIEGMKFSMAGWWAVGIGIVAAETRDRAGFNVMFEP